MPAGSGDRWPQDYERGRPGWPPGVVDRGGRRPGPAAGVERVVAVEPSEPMRRLLAALCPEAEALDGAAEAVPLADASMDAAFAAEAFHRFDHRQAVAELARVLRPCGALVLLWNLPAGPALGDARPLDAA